MRLSVAVIFSCLLASSLHAGYVMSQDLLLQFNDNGKTLAQTESTTTNTAKVDLNELNSDEWLGTGSVVSSGAAGLTYALPYTVALTDVSLTCSNQAGCSGGFHFTDTVTFSDASDFANQPYSIFVKGDGPGTFLFLSGKTGGFDAVGQVNAFLPDGTYDFKSSGLIGNVTVGLPSSASLGNATSPVTFQISASFFMDSSEYGQTVSLPHSFELMLGPEAAAPTGAPEPGSLALAGGCLLSGLAAFAWKRVRS